MNDTSKQLVDAAGEALSRGDLVVDRDVPVVTAAILRKLAALMTESGWYQDAEWPSPFDLSVLADDIEGGEK